jgi:hypothetical protein
MSLTIQTINTPSTPVQPVSPRELQRLLARRGGSSHPGLVGLTVPSITTDQTGLAYEQTRLAPKQRGCPS